MSESDKKWLVVGAGVVLFGLVILIRIGGAVLDVGAEREQAVEKAEAACEARVERTIEVPAPAPDYRAVNVSRQEVRPPSATRLATLRLPGRVSDHQKVLEVPTSHYVCLYRAAHELGGNVVVLERVEPTEGQEGRGTLVEAVYQVTAPAPPAPYTARFPHQATVVTDLFPGGRAEAAGLQPGDVLLDLDHRGLGEGAGEAHAVTQALDRLADEVPATLTVARGRAVLDLPVLKVDGKFGFHHRSAPVVAR